MVQFFIAEIRQSDVRPEAGGASFQTSEGEHQHAFLRKDRFEIQDTRRMRKIIIMNCTPCQGQSA